MSIERYKGQIKQNYKKILIVLFVLAFLLLLLLLMLLITYSSQEKTSVTIQSGVKTVKDVIEEHGSTYISEQESKDEDFYMEYFAKFKVLPYDENENSNEEYYNSLLEEIAEVLRYNSYKIVDKENDLIVKVVCDGTKIKSIIVNDIEDYFIYMDSQIELKRYVKIENTDFTITSELLNNIINNSWKNVIDFGQRDSIFDQYYIYINQGIKVRYIQDEIYNIIFTSNYKDNVINSLFPGIDLDTVVSELGKPSFESEELNVIGYKNERLYVFFTENEISIYRNLDTDIEDFLELSDKLIAEEVDLLDFMNELTDMWPDYSEYTYTSSSIFIAYPLKGIEIKLNYDDISGILVYNNIKESLSRIENYLKDTEFVSRLKLDAVFEAEQRRIIKNNNEFTKCDEYMESIEEERKKIIGESLNYKIYAEMDSNENIYSMKFISKDDRRANRELNDAISYYLWLTSNYFLYSKSGKGIYLYNLEDGIVTRIAEGSKEFELKGYENGFIKYDNEEIEFQY